MADYAGQIPTAPSHVALRDQGRGQMPPAGATKTYYYRTALGADGSTTDPSAIPEGAILERVVSS